MQKDLATNRKADYALITMMNTTKTLNVAETILAQLGGNKFVAMTGARNLIGDTDALRFKLPRGAKDGINHVRIALTAMDTYDVTFYTLGRAPSFNVTIKHKAEGVYADSLRSLFTSVTGLETSLGSLGGAR